MDEVIVRIKNLIVRGHKVDVEEYKGGKVVGRSGAKIRANIKKHEKSKSKGKPLLEIRRGWKLPSVGGERWKSKTQLAKLIARRGGNEGAFGGILHFFRRKRPCVKGSKWRSALESAGLKFDAQDNVIDWSETKNPL